MDTALIVEDDRDQADLVARLVRLRGFHPVIAGDGETGLGLALELSPDVVLLDLMLPDTDGFRVCQRLRADARTTRTPIVMVTAMDDQKYRSRGFRVGANAYLTKPYAAEDLFRAIDEARSWRDDLVQNELGGEIQVELDSDARFLQEVNDFLTGLASKTPLTTDQVMQVRQSIMELGMNAIEWGNRHRSELLVTILYRIFADRLEIVVRDQGAGFDMENLPHAASPDDPIRHLDVREKLGLRDGGFGLMICRGMADELKYNTVGNQVTLVKRFPPAAAELPGRDDRSTRGPDA